MADVTVAQKLARVIDSTYSISYDSHHVAKAIQKFASDINLPACKVAGLPDAKCADSNSKFGKAVNTELSVLTRWGTPLRLHGITLFTDSATQLCRNKSDKALYLEVVSGIGPSLEGVLICFSGDQVSAPCGFSDSFKKTPYPQEGYRFCSELK